MKKAISNDLGNLRWNHLVQVSFPSAENDRSNLQDSVIDQGLNVPSSLCTHEWNVVGRDDSRDVADDDACNAFNRLLSLVVDPRNDHRARRQLSLALDPPFV